MGAFLRGIPPNWEKIKIFEQTAGAAMSNHTESHEPVVAAYPVNGTQLSTACNIPHTTPNGNLSYSIPTKLTGDLFSKNLLICKIEFLDFRIVLLITDTHPSIYIYQLTSIP